MQGDQTMKLFLLFIFSFFIFLNCSEGTLKKNSQPDNETDNSEKLLKKYAREGFIDRNTFRMIHIEPQENDTGSDNVRKHTKKKSFVLLRKYLLSKGKKLSTNCRANLLNLIENNSELIRIKDQKNSRVIYVFEIKKSELASYIESQGE